MRFLFTLISIIYFTSCLFSQSETEQGNPYIQNYNSNDYSAPVNQTWAIIEDSRKIMYFGNKNGVLEFDGNRWRFIDIPNKSVVRSLAKDKNGKIYVGAKGELGFLEPDSCGVLKYTSLLSIIPKEHRNFGDVWHIHTLNEQVIFQTYTSVFILQNNQIKTLTPQNRFHLSFKVKNDFYVCETGKGLLKLKNNHLELIPGGERFSDDRIYSMLPLEQDKIMVLSRNNNIWVYTPNSLEENKFQKQNKFSEVERFNKKNHIYCGVTLKNNKLVFASLQNGILITDKKGNILQRINKTSGMQDQMVLSLSIDSKNNIWTGLNDGIAYIIANTPFAEYNEKNGILGNAYSVKKFKNKLYVGTSQGLFYKDSNNNFILIENTKGQNWSLSIINKNLYLTHNEGIYIIKGNKAKKIASNLGTVWNLRKLNNKPYILAGTNKGLVLLEQFKNTLKLRHKIKGFSENSRYCQIDNQNNIWISHPNKGVFRVELNSSLDSCSNQKIFSTEHGLPSITNNFVFKIKNHKQKPELLFGTENGIYEFNYQKQYFYQHKELSTHLKSPGFIDQFRLDTKGNIYFQQGTEKGVLQLQQDGKYTKNTTPFLKYKNLFVSDISIIDSNKIMYTSKDGLIQYNPNIHPNYNIPYQVTVVHEHSCKSYKWRNMEDSILIKEIPYKYNNINFSFSAQFYEDHDKTLYSYKLEGYNNHWSEWTNSTKKEYTNLHEKTYIFKVKAKNIYEIESTVAQYEFEISAPWYRTIPAYIFYLISSILFIWLIVKINTHRLKKDKEKLEKIILKRTKDLQESNVLLEEKQADLEIKQEEITTQSEQLIKINKELERHKDHLEQLVKERTVDFEKAKEKAEESDRLKSAFLANMSHEIRTPMNAIVGFSKILLKNKLDTDQQTYLINETNKNIYSLLYLIENILELAKIETNQVIIKKREFSITELLNKLFIIHRKSVENKMLEFVPEFNSRKEILIFSDEYRVKQILENLIDNAIKFTDKGSIKIGYKLENNLIIFFVKDTGIGMSKEEQHKIFARFTKAEDEHKKLYRGAGLGLAICKNISKLLDGELRVESKLNIGTSFYFSIPISLTQEDNIPVEKEQSTMPAYFWPDKTILIAEDNNSNFQLLELLLEDTKINIVHVKNGKEAVRICKENRFDLVLMDIRMPFMDGLEATQLIKAFNPELPIIAQTAYAMEKDEKISLEAGCDGYITKPIEEELLYSLLNKFLSR